MIPTSQPIAVNKPTTVEDQARHSFCHYHQWSSHPRYFGTLLRFSYNQGFLVKKNFPITKSGTGVDYQ